MALQSSGAISFSQIKTELASSSNSLRALSAAAGFSTPDAVSEFYGYSSVAPPSVTTNSLTGVGETYMTLNGNVTSDGGGTITQRGFYFGTNSSSPTNNTKITLGGTTGGISTVRYGLSSGTTYYCWAFATNASGTTYGSRVQANTIAAYSPTWYNTYSGGGYRSSDTNFNRCDFDCGAPNVGHRRRGYLYYLNPSTSSWVNYASLTQGAECSYISGSFNYHNSFNNSLGRANGQFALGIKNMAQMFIDVDSSGIYQGTAKGTIGISQSPVQGVSISNDAGTYSNYSTNLYINVSYNVGSGCPSWGNFSVQWDGV